MQIGRMMYEAKDDEGQELTKQGHRVLAVKTVAGRKNKKWSTPTESPTKSWSSHNWSRGHKWSDTSNWWNTPTTDWSKNPSNRWNSSTTNWPHTPVATKVAEEPRVAEKATAYADATVTAGAEASASMEDSQHSGELRAAPGLPDPPEPEPIGLPLQQICEPWNIVAHNGTTVFFGTTYYPYHSSPVESTPVEGDGEQPTPFHKENSCSMESVIAPTT